MHFVENDSTYAKTKTLGHIQMTQDMTNKITGYHLYKGQIKENIT